MNKSLQNLTELNSDLELIPKPKTFKITKGTISGEKYDLTHTISFMVNDKFVDIILGDQEMLVLKNYFESILSKESVSDFRDRVLSNNEIKIHITGISSTRTL